jgi:hypothetical protein
MSGRRSLIKGYFWRCTGRGCGHVFGLSRGQLDPLALMLSADPLCDPAWKSDPLRLGLGVQKFNAD